MNAVRLALAGLLAAVAVATGRCDVLKQFDFKQGTGDLAAFRMSGGNREPLVIGADGSPVVCTPDKGLDGGGLLIDARREPNGTGLGVMFDLPVRPAGREFRVSARMHTLDGAPAKPVYLALRTSHPSPFTRPASHAVPESTWRTLQTSWLPPRDSQFVRALLIIEAGGAVVIDDLQVELGDQRGYEDEPGLLLLQGAFRLTADRTVDAPQVFHPLPLAHAGQAPLTFDLVAEPADALASAHVRFIHGNPVAELNFKPLEKNASVEVRWESLVLAGPLDPDRAAPPPAVAPKPAEWPEEARPWLAPSWIIASDDPRFVAEAKRLTAETADVREIIRRAIARAKQIQSAARSFEDSNWKTHGPARLTATTALEFEGSCTSNANLLAALLRASGVPARFVAGYPNWSGPLQTHALVEAWLPGWGWYPLESTLLVEGWEPFRQIQVSVVPPEHETRALAGGMRWSLTGVPYLSLLETTTDPRTLRSAGILPDKENCDHVCLPWRTFAPAPALQAWAPVIKHAQENWRAWLTANEQPSRRLTTTLERRALEDLPTLDALSERLGRADAAPSAR